MKNKCLAAILVTVVLLSACSSASKNNAPMAESQFSKESYYDETYDTAAGYKMEDGTGSDVMVDNKKIIKMASLSMQTQDYSETAKNLESIVLGYSGYVESSNSMVYTMENKEYKRGSYVFRVPAESFEAAKVAIEGTGKVVSSSTGGEDVTTQYYDFESRRQIKEEEEKRVLEMIAGTQDIDGLILLEERLSAIRTDIELYQTRLNSIDRLSSYSTISVDINEVAGSVMALSVSDDIFTRMKQSFFSSINWLVLFFEAIIVFLAGAILPLCLIGIIAFVAWRAVRWSNKKSNKKNNIE